MSISVVIVNWNGGKYLRRCLTALRDQTRPADKIVVVDNASTDGSPAWAAAEFPEITLVRQESNLGFAAANNLAIREFADTEWIALLNPDAFPAPAWLAALERSAREFPEHVFFGSRMLRASSPDLMDGTGDCYHVSGLVWRRDSGIPAAAAHNSSDEIFAPCAAAAFYRRDAFIAAGGFDEDFYCYLEDVDLGFRLRLAGHRCRYIADAVVYHVGSGISGKQSDFSVYHGHRNLVWCYVRNMPTLLFWLYLPQHLALNLLSLIVLTYRGQGDTILRAKRDALKGLPKALRKRRRQQSEVAVRPWQLRRLMERGVYTFFRHRAS